MHLAPAILLSSAERATLTAWANATSRPVRVIQRAQIVTMAADGVRSRDIADQLEISRPTVQLWRERFLALRVTGLEKDAPRPGRIPSIPVTKIRVIVEATLYTKPSAATQWSTRTLAQAPGVSEATVRRIWTQHNRTPHWIKTCTLSRDKQCLAKRTDVVGLYLNPPDKAWVLCVDEQRQIQALDRTHDYKRHGMTTLFAALSMLDGKVIGDCMPRHRHQECIRFLKKIDSETPAARNLHLIVDHDGPHKHPRVKSWIRRHPRFHLHVIPTSSSWVNMVARWFREITDKRMRRGAFRSVPELIAAIEDYMNNHNQNPRVFVWTASVEGIMAKIAKCKEALDALH